ncbi:hypothetical protein [Afipia sp. 1NLS2]|uniref:hypothetical protein n=1 Tax=Afipia sp. 1NLS2 TaxID=666684 RepID=UPI0001DA14EF|nr:hypothetical protein [Afipia sp. 1NLS2]EFI52793.1 hypothetical protein AfiDRAFT_0780 [Afipia sp. 1NLS2]
MTIAHNLDFLREAGPRQVPWLQVAEALHELEANSNRAPDGRTWIAYAAETSKLTDNQLRRFTRALEFLREVEAKAPRVGEGLRVLPFSHIEVLGKIWQLDRAKSLELIDSAGTVRYTYLDLLGKYRDLRSKGTGHASPIAAGKHAAKQFIDACRRILLETKELTAGNRYPRGQRTILRPIVGLGYTNPDYIIRDLSTPSAPQLDAIDCYFISGASQSDALRRKIPQVAFESTFFTHFWCLMPPSALAGNFISACNNLKLANVGLVLIDVANGSCSTILEPDASATPMPDRRSQIFFSYGYKRLRSVQA